MRATDVTGGCWSTIHRFLQRSRRQRVRRKRGGDWVCTHDTGASPALVSTTDPLGHTWDYQFDVARRLKRITSPLERTWSYTHDSNGNRLTSTDPLDRVITYTYDALNNLKSVEADGKVTLFDYLSPVDPTALSQVTEMADPPGSSPVTTFEYYGPGDGQEPGEWNGLLKKLKPATWKGKTDGTAKGNPAMADGKPVWRLDQVWPPKPDAVAE